jgi:hypothetical protein
MFWNYSYLLKIIALLKRVVQMGPFGSHFSGGGCLLLDLVQTAYGKRDDAL